MLSTLSSNVVLAKAHAMYGRRLTGQNYKDFLACHSVSEITAYLKNHTAYSQILSGINENDIHRGHLEVLLRQRIFEDSAALCRYEISVGEHFARYLLEKAEIEQIMHSITHLMAGSPEEYLFTLPSYLNRHSHIDLPALARIRTFQELLDALSHTPYRKVIERFRPIEGQPLDYFGIENSLYQYLYSQLFATIQEHTHGQAREELEDLFNVFADVENYISIIRLKYNYHSGPDFIKSSLLPFGTLKPRHIDAMLEADTPEQTRAELEKASVVKKLRKLNLEADLLSTQAEYAVSKRYMRFSTHPCVVMLSYMFIMQIELHDLTNIIEGVRYQVPAADIQEMLTILNFPRKG